MLVRQKTLALSGLVVVLLVVVLLVVVLLVVVQPPEVRLVRLVLTVRMTVGKHQRKGKHV
jgi:hypothetical protein